MHLGLALALIATARADAPVTDVEALHAFARVYGAVRWFHPSDEAAVADWDGIAVDGAARVLAADTRDALAAELEAVFAPVAPTLDVFQVGGSPTAPEFPAGKTVAWQRRGFGDGRGTYAAHRSARTDLAPERSRGWIALMQTHAADALRGREVRLTARTRIEPTAAADSSAVWLRVDRPDNRTGFFDNMSDRPIRSGDWTEVVIEGRVDDDAERLVFGSLTTGLGVSEYDDFALEVRADDGTWGAVPLENGSFDQRLRGWTPNGPGYRFKVVGADRHLRISPRYVAYRGDLFDRHAEIGDAWTAEIGAGLAGWMPLALPSVRGHTWRPDGHPPDPGARQGIRPEELATRVADVVVLWSTIAQFYPYLDVIGEDWEAALDGALADALASPPEDQLFVLRRLVAHMRDGHAWVTGPGRRAQAPIRLARADGRIVVVRTVEGSDLQPGDLVDAVDGTPVDEAFARAAAHVSGSPQWIDARLLDGGGLFLGPADTTATVTVTRDGTQHTFDVARAPISVPPAFDHPQIDRLDDGVFVIDLSRATWADIRTRLDEIAAAPGVVFDLRGYPNSNHQVLAHLLTEPDDTEWMFVPELTRPDQSDVTWVAHGWEMRPAEPHIAGRVAWLTGGGAISYAESVMGFVEHFDLGTIVGGPTAGANGNVTRLTTPGGYEVPFTGMKVLRADGRQHHTIGILPDVPVERTIAGIREGRDEVLERALEIVRRAP